MKKTTWLLPTDLLKESVAIMRQHGAIGNEGLALWFGVIDGDRAKVTHIVEVSGPGFQTTPLYMCLSLKAMSTLTDLAEKLDAVLLGQIHSHPGQMLELSELDKAHGIQSRNYLSVVCPFYAQRDLDGFSDCGVHVFEQHNYRRLSSNEIMQRLVVTVTTIHKVHCEVPK